MAYTGRLGIRTLIRSLLLSLPCLCASFVVDKTRYRVVTVQNSPGYDGDLSITGDFSFTESVQNYSYTINYELRGLGPEARGTWDIHAGVSCDDPGPHFVLENGVDPWKGADFLALGNGVAVDSFTVTVGPDTLVGHPLLVYLEDGTIVGCGMIEATDTPPSTSPPLSPETSPKIWPGVGEIPSAHGTFPVATTSAMPSLSKEFMWYWWPLIVLCLILGFSAAYALCTGKEEDEDCDSEEDHEALEQGMLLIWWGLETARARFV